MSVFLRYSARIPEGQNGLALGLRDRGNELRITRTKQQMGSSGLILGGFWSIRCRDSISNKMTVSALKIVGACSVKALRKGIQAKNLEDKGKISIAE